VWLMCCWVKVKSVGVLALTIAGSPHHFHETPQRDRTV
jgi:hypothetical protein